MYVLYIARHRFFMIHPCFSPKTWPRKRKMFDTNFWNTGKKQQIATEKTRNHRATRASAIRSSRAGGSTAARPETFQRWGCSTTGWAQKDAVSLRANRWQTIWHTKKWRQNLIPDRFENPKLLDFWKARFTQLQGKKQHDALLPAGSSKEQDVFGNSWAKIESVGNVSTTPLIKHSGGLQGKDRGPVICKVGPCFLQNFWIFAFC